MVPAWSKAFLDIQANYKVWIHSGARMWHDNNISQMYHTDNNHSIAQSTKDHIG